jgi:hypothetical protein
VRHADIHHGAARSTLRTNSPHAVGTTSGHNGLPTDLVAQRAGEWSKNKDRFQERVVSEEWSAVAVEERGIALIPNYPYPRTIWQHASPQSQFRCCLMRTTLITFAGSWALTIGDVCPLAATTGRPPSTPICTLWLLENVVSSGQTLAPPPHQAPSRI